MVRSEVTIDVGALSRNARTLVRALDGAQLWAVVKADGYGHGAVDCAAAALGGGASAACVATVAEALELRRALPAARIVVMGPAAAHELGAARDASLELVAGDGVPEGLRVHVKLDTGMGRLGTFDPAEARAVCDLAAADERLDLVGVMTHFATADELGDDHFPAQLERFRAFASDAKGAYPGAIAHAANSAATLRDPAAHLDMVRCGVAVYGLDPFGEDPAERDLEPALALESYLAAIKRFEPGWSAGYGRTWRAERPTWVGTVPIGYGDGWRRALSNRGEVLVGGRRRRLAGTVSMDNLTVEIGRADAGPGIPDANVGDPVVLIGEQGGERILCEEVARVLDTINYEVTCGLLARVPRRYQGA
jgi:alanine racemase